MVSGGARAHSGFLPDPTALRRDRPSDKAGQVGWTHLPAAGRQGDTPEWPLPRPLKREIALWTAEWKRPQAVMWEANGQELEVATYVRWFVRAEHHDAPVGLGTLVKQLQEALGLSLPGLARNRWIIASTSDEIRPRVVASASSKERLSGS
jgi:hypothetical protein